MPMFTVTGYSGTSQVFSESFVVSGVEPIFFGFQSSVGKFSSVTVRGTAPTTLTYFNFALDNFTFRATTAVSGVPEPAAWSLMILGFSAAGAAMRLRRRVTTVAFGAASPS